MSTHLTMSELQVGLAEAGVSPQDKGVLELIVCRPDIGERQVLEQAELHQVEGLVGDNWSVRGSKDTEGGHANPDAQIAIMNSRIIHLLAQDKARWPLAGDQLFVDLDVSVGNLQPGQRLAIGSAVLEITDKPHTGCAKFTERFGHDG